MVGAVLAEMGARRSIPGLIEGLEGLISSGITDPAIHKAIEDLNDSSGFQFFSSDRTDAASLLENYGQTTGDAMSSMTQLSELKQELQMMEAEGISSPELTQEVNAIEQMVDSQVEAETNADYLENLKNITEENKGD